MKRLKSIALAAMAILLCVMLHPASSAFADAGQGGAIDIAPSSGGSVATYRAYHIADPGANPINDQFDWPSLSGVSLDGRKPYPVYNPSSDAAVQQGRTLVKRVSDDLLNDDAGVLAQALSGYIAEGAQPVANITSGSGAVAVEDGWYLLVASGRRPLFAWVDGAVAKLGDKSDTPTICKQVDTGSGWSDAAIAGSGRAIHYRIDVAVPLSIESVDSYPLTLVDTWDKGLTLEPSTVSVRVLPTGSAKGAQDITGSVYIDATDGSLSVRVSDLNEFGLKPGDVLRVEYRMDLPPQVAFGAQGLKNSAYATFPSWNGSDKTPSDVASVYAMRVQIAKVDGKGKPLAGAVLAIRNQDGWLGQDGTFGPESKRLEVTTGSDGLAPFEPALSDGSYEVVELVAPKGFRAPKSPSPFVLKARVQQEELTVTARASAPLKVSQVDANKATVKFELLNERKAGAGIFGSFLPQTGDRGYGASVLALMGIVLVGIASLRLRVARE